MKYNKKPKKNAQRPIKMQSGEELHFSEYEISFDPVDTKAEKVPIQVKNQIQGIYDLITSDPKLAIEKLLVLKEQYPQVPMLYNHLSAAYMQLGNRKVSQEIINENYRTNPNYLFAKLGYAQLCLGSGEYEKIPVIFDNKFDLKMLYPDRNKFHVTEFTGFTAVMCAYYSCMGKKETAELLYKTLIEVDPEARMISFAEQYLHPSLGRRIMNWLGQRAHKIESRAEQRKNK